MVLVLTTWLLTFGYATYGERESASGVLFSSSLLNSSSKGIQKEARVSSSSDDEAKSNNL